MKASMDQTGLITLTPDSGAEAYALQKWAVANAVPVVDLLRSEGAYWRQSGLMVSTSIESPVPSSPTPIGGAR